MRHEALPAAGGISAAGQAPKGGFENGGLGRWTRAKQEGSSGNWFIYSGTSGPFSNNAIAAPPQGRFAVTTDQDGPGSHVFYRNFRLKGERTHKLSFYLYYRNHNGTFFTPNSLDYTDDPNEQYRVDILKRNADPFTVERSAILATLFRTKVGDPERLAPKLLTFNLTRFGGSTVRLRFAEVDTENFFLASVDKVSLTRRRERRTR